MIIKKSLDTVAPPSTNYIFSNNIFYILKIKSVIKGNKNKTMSLNIPFSAALWPPLVLGTSRDDRCNFTVSNTFLTSLGLSTPSLLEGPRRFWNWNKRPKFKDPVIAHFLRGFGRIVWSEPTLELRGWNDRQEQKALENFQLFLCLLIFAPGLGLSLGSLLGSICHPRRLQSCNPVIPWPMENHPNPKPKGNGNLAECLCKTLIGVSCAWKN